MHYTIPTLASLQDLRQIQLYIQTDESLARVKKMRCRYLVELLLKLPALRPSISVVVMEDGRFFFGHSSSVSAITKFLTRH